MKSRYHKFSSFLKKKYGDKVWKICVDAGFSCPNRDPETGEGGCLFCRLDSFSKMQSRHQTSVKDQIQDGITAIQNRYGIKKFIVYFQSSTNTFAPVAQLASLFYQAMEFDQVIGLSIATRPDCLPHPVMDLIADCAMKTDIWIELGLQSAHNQTLERIGRGHDYQTYLDAVDRLQHLKVRICTHIMLGLPGESDHHVQITAKELARSPIHEVKIHPMLILRETALEKMASEGQAHAMRLPDYVRQVCDFLEQLPPEMVIQRLTAEAPSDQLIAPRWAMNKTMILNAIVKELEKRDSWQGKFYFSQSPS